MNTHFQHTSLLVETARARNALNNFADEFDGAVTLLPTLPSRITLQTGKLLITAGERLTALSMKNVQLSEDMA